MLTNLIFCKVTNLRYKNFNMVVSKRFGDYKLFNAVNVLTRKLKV